MVPNLNTLNIFLILFVPSIAYMWLYISQLNSKIALLTEGTIKLNEIIAALDKKCAVLEIAKQAADNTTGILNTQLKIAEVSAVMNNSNSLMSTPNFNYAMIAIGLTTIIGVTAYFYFGWSITSVVKATALVQSTNNSQNAIIMTNSINDTITKTLTAPDGVILTSFSNQEKHLSTVTTMLNNTLTHSMNQLGAKIDVLTTAAKNNTLLDSTSSIDMSEIGQLGDLLGVISTNL